MEKYDMKNLYDRDKPYYNKCMNGDPELRGMFLGI